MTRKSIITQSPGRINLIGEHTDYNDGFVLPAAINKKAIFRLTKNGTDKDINIYSENIGNHFSFELFERSSAGIDPPGAKVVCVQLFCMLLRWN